MCAILQIYTIVKAKNNTSNFYKYQGKKNCPSKVYPLDLYNYKCRKLHPSNLYNYEDSKGTMIYDLWFEY